MGKQKIVGWLAIIVGVLVAPHWIVTQLLVSGVLVAFGMSAVYGGFPLPSWLPSIGVSRDIKGE